MLTRKDFEKINNLFVGWYRCPGCSRDNCTDVIYCRPPTEIEVISAAREIGIDEDKAKEFFQQTEKVREELARLYKEQEARLSQPAKPN